MARPLGELVRCWMARGGMNPAQAPDPSVLEAGFLALGNPCRPGADPRTIAAWEERHGYRLPAGLRAWLMLSNGLYRCGPLIHPISAIGPMVPFARVPEMIVQPESWFEVGNPNLQTVCIDLASQHSTALAHRAEGHHLNLRILDAKTVCVTLDETASVLITVLCPSAVI